MDMGGVLRSETTYTNGREDGGLYECYENGSLKFEEKYAKGKK
jgi:antitoxin component YwqK of YwqJK toxin-antitoxin module